VLIENEISRCRPVLHSQGGKTAAVVMEAEHLLKIDRC
jgi:hypothetical protein